MSKRKNRKRSSAPRSGPVRASKPNSGISGDLGPNTASARRSSVVEPVTHIDEETGEVKNSPNNVKRRRRIDLVEGYQRRNIITKRQLLAAQAFRTAFEQTQKSPPAINPVQVDTSPKPDSAVDIMLSRVSIFRSVSKHATLDWHLLFHVCCEDRAITSYPGCTGRAYQAGVDRLRHALDVLADNMGY